jgi:putative transposase
MQYKLSSSRHTKYLLYIHWFLLQRKIFIKSHLDFMPQVFHDVCKSFGAQLVEFDGEKDHVHLLVLYPPKVAIATLVNSLKGVSSRMLRKNFPIFKELYHDDALWSVCCFYRWCSSWDIKAVSKLTRLALYSIH